MRIGILGGSFNPAHNAHIEISKIAIKFLKLDVVWWVITPKNPLKNNKDLASFSKRLQYAQKFTKYYPQIIVSDIEKQLETSYSYDTILGLKKYYPNSKFVWIMGSDNIEYFHYWNNWKKILNQICIVNIARPPATNLVKNCPVRMLKNKNNIILTKPNIVKIDINTIYWIKNNKLLDISSTKIRNKIL